MLALIALPWSAAAHPELSPTLVNRYVTAAVLGDTMEVSFALLAGPVPARDLRRQLDGNGDGAIDAGEQANARESWVRDHRGWMSLDLDGERLLLSPSASIDLGGDTGVGQAPVVIELRATWPIGRVRHELRLVAAREPDRLGETELSVVPGPDWRVAASSEGRGPLDKSDTRYLWTGARPAGSFAAATFAIEPVDASAPRNEKAPLAAIAVAGLGIVVAGFGIFAVARFLRRRRG